MAGSSASNVVFRGQGSSRCSSDVVDFEGASLRLLACVQDEKRWVNVARHNDVLLHVDPVETLNAHKTKDSCGNYRYSVVVCTDTLTHR